MKAFQTIFFIAFILSNSSLLNAQNCATAITASLNETLEFTPSQCSSTLENCEYFIVDLNHFVGVPDTSYGPRIIGSTSLVEIDPIEFGLEVDSCYNIVPFCYDINPVKILVDGINNSQDCCDLMENFYPGLCSLVEECFPDSSMVENLADVLKIITQLGGDQISVYGFIDIVNIINDNAGILSLFCGSDFDEIDICADQQNPETFIMPVIELEKIVNEFKIFPNPIDDWLSIELNFSKQVDEVNIDVVNLTGERIYSNVNSFQSGQKNINMDLSEIISGSYFLIIKSEGIIIIEKFIKN